MSSRALAVCLCTAVTFGPAPRLLAQPGTVGDGPAALPAAHRVGLVSQHERLVALHAGASYGYTESVLGANDSHHRIGGTLAASLWPLDWLAFALRFDGRYDRHSDGDDGFVGDPYLYVRAGGPIGGGPVSLGGELRLWYPGSDAPSVEFAATSLDLSLLVTFKSGGVTLGGQLGFRLDRSTESADDADQLSPSDRLALSLSESNAILYGLAATYRAGALELLLEVTWDLLVGDGSPSAGESPIRIAAGARAFLAGDLLQLSILGEVSPSGRPSIAPTAPLVQVEPRFRLVLGLGVRFPAEDEVETEPDVEPDVVRVPLHGTIVGRDGAGVAGATVRVAGAEDETDDGGVFELDDVPVGTHELRVTAPGHVEAVQQITVSEEGEAPEIRVALTPARGTIRGRILRPDGAPLDGATVRYGEHETMTDGSGRFELRDVPMGQGQITVEALGFVTGSSAIDVPVGGDAEVEVSLERALPAGQIRGQVLSFDGTPVAQARVRVEGTDIALTTGDDGQFETDVPPGDYTVVFEADQHVGQRRRVTVEDMGVTVINVDLRRRR